ncbi:DNA-directed DNA polymerase X [Niveomyces insectorum RCEF 264]|uniref:DNA polymerase n=1 Tax=Niveomyces insectorum RCEF 264 TaxID=1081102 RepID=A0A167X551_9HYPO|nr:DNA-directed DNA polymerase X [Niveomyces insectorum RCEF 264]
MASALPFPSIYLLPTHLSPADFHRLEREIPTRTRVAEGADVILGKLSEKERAIFELRRLGIATVEEEIDPARKTKAPLPPAAKRRKTGGKTSAPVIVISSDSSSGDEATSRVGASSQQGNKVARRSNRASSSPRSAAPATVKVVKLAWFTDSVARGKVLPLSDYTVYQGQRTDTARVAPATTTGPPSSQPKAASKAGEILQRAHAHAHAQGQPSKGSEAARPAPHGSSSSSRPSHWGHDGSSRRQTFNTPVNPPALVRTTTSEHDKARALPPIPDYLHTTYSCQRPTPVHPPNDAFIAVLKKIRVARQLTGDKVGVRAYSTAIASLAAYPYTLSAPQEVARLPGCGAKIAELFREFDSTDGGGGGHVREADDDEADPKLAVLRLFYNIWGVAETTARAFYNRGWRDLDDVVEFGWPELNRVQQIGVKYYDELQEPLTRRQVEAIAEKVLAHANRIHPGFQMVIAGGYRRGKERSGDVDVILSHPDEAVTHGLVGRLVLSLEQAGLVTHTLILTTANSDRGQQPVSWKGNAPRRSGTTGATGGAGFDTLDKALVVWQEPADEAAGSSRRATDGNDNAKGEEDKKKHNPNPHRRVDIIVSPWKTVGCAVLGWTSGTTFQRDLRRYCKYERGLRFDSSGVRSRKDGSWVDLEDFARDPAPDMLTAERRVFAALGLEWRPPEERCTG